MNTIAHPFRPGWTWTLLIALAATVSGTAGQSVEPVPGTPLPARPNIVLIEADDLGYGDLGCYGQEVLATPNLDRLAEEGMRLNRFYAGNTVCSPSRDAMLTGRHPGHATIRGNISFLPTGEVTMVPIAATDRTIADILREAGYATGLAGKWHLDAPHDPESHPEDHGFDYAATLIIKPVGQGKFSNYPETFTVNGRTVLVRENYPDRRGIWKDDIVTRHALHFLRTHRDDPFFLFVSFYSPHAPMDYEA